MLVRYFNPIQVRKLEHQVVYQPRCFPYVRYNKKYQAGCFFSTTIPQESSNGTDGNTNWFKRAKYNVQRNKVLDLDEALYIAREAGIATRKEIQKQVMTSPPFSPDKSPFLIENFFPRKTPSNPLFSQTNTKTGIAKKKMHPVLAKEKNSLKPKKTKEEKSQTKVDQEAKKSTILTKTIQEHFGPRKTEEKQTFWYNGLEYLCESRGKGTNRTATAYVILRKGIGRIFFLKGKDFVQRFRHYYYRFAILQPFHLTRTTGVFDVYAVCMNGGQAGQSAALKLAIGRALVNANPNTANILQKETILYEDKRQHWPSAPMRKRSRAGMKFNKR